MLSNVSRCKNKKKSYNPPAGRDKAGLALPAPSSVAGSIGLWNEELPDQLALALQKLLHSDNRGFSPVGVEASNHNISELGIDRLWNTAGESSLE